MSENSHNVLVVEDDFYIRELYVRELEKSNFKVRVADNVKLALEEIAKEKPELIMLDLMLPIRSGFDVLEHVKGQEELKSIKVVILSNLGEDEIIKKGFSKGADGYLIKASQSSQYRHWL